MKPHRESDQGGRPVCSKKCSVGADRGMASAAHCRRARSGEGRVRWPVDLVLLTLKGEGKEDGCATKKLTWRDGSDSPYTRWEQKQGAAGRVCTSKARANHRLSLSLKGSPLEKSTTTIVGPGEIRRPRSIRAEMQRIAVCLMFITEGPRAAESCRGGEDLSTERMSSKQEEAACSGPQS